MCGNLYCVYCRVCVHQVVAIIAFASIPKDVTASDTFHAAARASCSNSACFTKTLQNIHLAHLIAGRVVKGGQENAYVQSCMVLRFGLRRQCTWGWILVVCGLQVFHTHACFGDKHACAQYIEFHLRTSVRGVGVVVSHGGNAKYAFIFFAVQTREQIDLCVNGRTQWWGRGGSGVGAR